MTNVTLAAGDRLGPYEIVSLLGSGGMGEVYRARDTRLNRQVAIKLLRGGLDPSAQSRFKREAETVASLNHPNIVALYEIGKEGAVEYTVSELVEGENLRSRLATGALPVRQCVDIATQIADGLACAHAAGIVHRDLKPENVMISRDGRVKILDFGLARQMTVAAFGSGTHISAETIAAPIAEPDYRTHTGMVLGTASYMSPEQARGEDADYRSDQFSLGLVLYEMLTGTQPFARSSAVETMAAIVREDPPPLPENLRVPGPLLWVLERLLEKDRERRFDSTRDLYQQLRAIETHWSSASSSALFPASQAEAGKTPARTAPIWLTVGALALGLAAGAVAGWWPMRNRPDLAAYRYTPFAVNTSSQAWWSRDSKTILYSARVKDVSQIFLAENGAVGRQVTQLATNSWPLGFDDDNAHLFFTHEEADGARAVWRISRVGGNAQRLIDVSTASALAISPDGDTLVTLSATGKNQLGLKYSSPIGSPWKTFAPDWMRKQLTESYNEPQLAFTPNSKELLLIVDVANGHELAWRIAWPPQADAAEHKVEMNVARSGFTPLVSFMPDGKRIVLSANPAVDQTSNIYIGKPGGPYRQVTSSTHGYVAPTVSPDGKAMAFVVEDSDFDIVSVAVTDGTEQDVVATSRAELMPAWTTNSDVMAYITDRGGSPEIWIHRSNGMESRVLGLKDMPPGTLFLMDPVPSPDGNRIVFAAAGEGFSNKLWLVPAGGGSVVRVTNAPAATFEAAPYWSPDGSQIAYLSTQHGSWNLNLVSSDGTATPASIYTTSSENDLVMPTWVPGGDKILIGDNSTLFTIRSSGADKHVLARNVRVNSMAISRDGNTAYGIRSDAANPVLFSMDMQTGAMHDIKQLPHAMRPASNLNPGTLVTLSPDGKLLTFATRQQHNSLWTFEGFQN